MSSNVQQSVSDKMNDISHFPRIIVSGKKVIIKEHKISYSEAVGAGANQQVTITPSVGKLARLRYVGFSAPAIATSTSNHEFYLTHGSGTGGYERVMSNTVAGTSAMSLTPSTNPSPLLNLPFTSDYPIVATYLNATNLSQTGARLLKVVWEEEDI